MSFQQEVEAFVSQRKFSIALVTFLGASAVIIVVYSLASWLLFVGFGLLVLALGLLWSSVNSLGEEGKMSLEEALDLAAPARDEERKLAVLRGLKDLEYEYGLGKISDDDYKSISGRYRHEARGLLQRLDSSEQALKDRVLAELEKRLGKSPPAAAKSTDSSDASSAKSAGESKNEASDA